MKSPKESDFIEKRMKGVDIEKPKTIPQQKGHIRVSSNFKIFRIIP